jgi:hypothetical protein
MRWLASATGSVCSARRTHWLHLTLFAFAFSIKSSSTSASLHFVVLLLLVSAITISMSRGGTHGRSQLEVSETSESWRFYPSRSWWSAPKTIIMIRENKPRTGGGAF